MGERFMDAHIKNQGKRHIMYFQNGAIAANARNMKQIKSEKKRETESDRRILRELIKMCINELKCRLQRMPSQNELLDYLFSKDRNDMEAKYLERRLQRLLKRQLGADY